MSSVKRAESLYWKGIYSIKSTLLKRIPKAHCLRRIEQIELFNFHTFKFSHFLRYNKYGLKNADDLLRRKLYGTHDSFVT